MRQPDAVTNMKQRLEKKLGEVEDDLHPEGLQVEEGEETISWTRPTITSGNAAWIYEVDLHHNIFHINEIPFFFAWIPFQMNMVFANTLLVSLNTSMAT